VYARAHRVYTYIVAPFVCPVNYSRSKLSGNEVPASSPGPSSHLPASPRRAPRAGTCLRETLSLLAALVPPSPPSVGHPVERERTNKSARAPRRDIVSCKVNHLRGSKTASSPCRDLLSAARALEETFVTSARCLARYSLLLGYRHFSPPPSLSLSLSLLLPSRLPRPRVPRARLPRGRSS
jgi:hypothetical protein